MGVATGHVRPTHPSPNHTHFHFKRLAIWEHQVCLDLCMKSDGPLIFEMYFHRSMSNRVPFLAFLMAKMNEYLRIRDKGLCAAATIAEVDEALRLASRASLDRFFMSDDPKLVQSKSAQQ
jgi:hypothetical protein